MGSHSFADRLAALEALEAEQEQPLTAIEREWLLGYLTAMVAAGQIAEVADYLVPDVLSDLRPAPHGLHGSPEFLQICGCGLCAQFRRWHALGGVDG